MQIAIHGRMAGVDRNIMTYRALDAACLRRLAAYLFQSVEEQRMVGDDELATEHNSLIDNRFCDVCCQQDGLYIHSRITHLHSRVVPSLLVTQGSYRFYAMNDIP